MVSRRIRFGGVLAALTTLYLVGVQPGAAQTVDVTGTWSLRVTTDQGVTNPSFTLEQDGENLTGQYSSEALGEADLAGTVRGSSVTISFTASLQGQSIPVVYRGTVDDEGAMSGTIDIAAGAMSGTFTATRSDG
jgi:hypothetical protein